MIRQLRYIIAMCWMVFTTQYNHCAFTTLLNKVRVKALNAVPLQSIKAQAFHHNTQRVPTYQFSKMTSRYDQWPTAFINLRDLVYGKYNFVNEAFAPIVKKGVATMEVEKFPARYINTPYVEKPIPYGHGWQVTNRTLLKTIVDQTANKYSEAYTNDEQMELVQIALEKGADPFYDPAIESDSEGYNNELHGNAIEIALKLKNLGALEAIINYLQTQDLLEDIDTTLKETLDKTLNDYLKNASDEQKIRINKLLEQLNSKKIEGQNDFETLD